MNFLSRRRTSLALAATASLLLTACGGSSDTGGPADQLVVGSIYEHDGFDPLNPLAASANGERLIPVFDTLLRVNTDGDVEPFLAEGMDSTDGQTWTMTLREGVTFTDDTPFDADAVIYNVERHRAPDSPSSSKSLLDGLVTLTAADPQTVVFELDEPNWSFPYLFTASGALGLIGSPTAFEKDEEGFNSKPVGAGPFEVVEWVPDDQVTLKRNPDYWGEEPAYDTLTYRVLPDPQSRENALRTGQIDVSVSVSNFDVVESSDDLTLHTNGARGALALLPNVSAAPLDDSRVRRAIQLAVDPANTSNAVFGGAGVWDGQRGCLPFATGSAQCEPSSVEPDLEEARDLVADYKADGNDVSIEILASNTTTTLAEYVAQVLTDTGLKPTIRTVGVVEHIPALYSGDYQLGLWQMTPFESFYPLGYTVFSATARNVIKHAEPALHAALEQSVNGATMEERNEGLRETQRVLEEEALVTWLAPAPLYLTTRDGVDLGDDYLGGLSFYASDVTVSK